MAGTYEVSGTSDDSRVQITATDDEAIASSEGYTTRAGALGDIGSVERNADSRFVGLMEQTWNGEVVMGEITTADGKYSLRFSEGIIESIWRPGTPMTRHGPSRLSLSSGPASSTGSWQRPWAGSPSAHTGISPRGKTPSSG
jgi:uncharacterized protein YegP (UPF0339 family)